MKKLDEKKALSTEEKKELREKINITMGKQIGKARSSPKNDYSLCAVAKYLDTSYSHIARIESGVGNTYFADVKILADFLGVSLDSLCSDSELETPQNSSPWFDIHPIHAFISILIRFQPIIELGDENNESLVKLSFNFNHFLEQGEKFKEFFKQYQVIDNLIKSNLECAEEVDILASRLIDKYKDINTPKKETAND